MTKNMLNRLKKVARDLSMYALTTAALISASEKGPEFVRELRQAPSLIREAKEDRNAFHEAVSELYGPNWTKEQINGVYEALGVPRFQVLGSVEPQYSADAPQMAARLYAENPSLLDSIN